MRRGERSRQEGSSGREPQPDTRTSTQELREPSQSLLRSAFHSVCSPGLGLSGFIVELAAAHLQHLTSSQSDNLVKFGGCVSIAAARAPLTVCRATFWCMAPARSRGSAHLGRGVCDASAPLEAGWTAVSGEIAPVRAHRVLRPQQTASSPRPTSDLLRSRAVSGVFEVWQTVWPYQKHDYTR